MKYLLTGNPIKGKAMDESDPLEARTKRLHNLRDTDPVAWAICCGVRGLTTIANTLNLPPDQVQIELKRLIKTKDIKATPYKGTKVYRPASIELKRLSRRAYALRPR